MSPLIADLGTFQLKHQALIWANGGRWCADVDEASGEVLEQFQVSGSHHNSRLGKVGRCSGHRSTGSLS